MDNVKILSWKLLCRDLRWTEQNFHEINMVSGGIKYGSMIPRNCRFGGFSRFFDLDLSNT